MGTPEVGKDYALDLGSLCPVAVRVLRITEEGVVVQYLNSWPGRVETISHKLWRLA